MAETPVPSPAPSVPERLRDLAQLLRGAEHLPSEAQRRLADLVDELSQTLHPETLSSEETAHLADSAAQLLLSFHAQEDEGRLAHLKHRLEQAIVRAETEAPMTTGLARQLMDTLANLGI
jgi:hypothetical protein